MHYFEFIIYYISSREGSLESARQIIVRLCVRVQITWLRQMDPILEKDRIQHEQALNNYVL